MLDGIGDLRERRVAFLAPPGFQYVAILWGIWRAGGVAVPLAVSHPLPELDYTVSNSGAEILVAHPEFETRLQPIAQARRLRFLPTKEMFQSANGSLPMLTVQRRAMILYTSGTTSKPKGVVTTHANIQAQVESLIAAWGWTATDHILHVLPLHHLHGILNVLTCALWAGAKCEILPRFDADEVWATFLRGGVTLFMAVPTIYMKLISAWDAASPEEQKRMSRACSSIRLMVSGSAALPVSTLERWKQISGHVLLERYGMTETCMILSNPLDGERRPGSVGVPLPGIEVRLVDEKGNEVSQGIAGEIYVRGPGVFSEYWRNQEATNEAFRDGWFRTGDVAVWENGGYRMLGRSSVDIIKTGGFKVSGLEIEEVLRTHPTIAECAVVGLADDTWGERVCAALVLDKGKHLSLDELRAWAKERLAVYKIPSQIAVLESLPRNAMGKVVKPELAKMLAKKK